MTKTGHRVTRALICFFFQIAKPVFSSNEWFVDQNLRLSHSYVKKKKKMMMKALEKLDIRCTCCGICNGLQCQPRKELMKHCSYLRYSLIDFGRTVREKWWNWHLICSSFKALRWISKLGWEKLRTESAICTSFLLFFSFLWLLYLSIFFSVDTKSG